MEDYYGSRLSQEGVIVSWGDLVYTLFMSITREEILGLLKISGLSFAEDETGELVRDLNEMLEGVVMLDEVDTEGVEPTCQVLENQNGWREDEVEEDGVGREDLLALAAETRDHQIKVPKIL